MKDERLIGLTRITNDELETFELNFSRCTNHDIAPLNKLRLNSGLFRLVMVVVKARKYNQIRK